MSGANGAGREPCSEVERRESKPEERSDEPVGTGATRRETHMSTATARDETRRAIAKPPTPRASLVADLADHVRELAFVGDLEAARIACEALAQLLGTSDASSPVVDLARVRGRR